MDDKVLVKAFMAFTAGTALGFAIGYFLNKRESESKAQEAMEAFKLYSQKSEEINNDECEDDVKFEGVKAAKFAKPDGTKGINYSKYNKDLQEKIDSESPSDDDPDDEDELDDDINMEDYEETYEEMLERQSEEYIEHAEQYRREHKGKIELMQSDEWDTDFPETDYEHQDLYYFTEDDKLTDEDGNVLDEEEYIGPKVRQVGWMRSPDDVIYIRNHPKEKEYRVFKERCAIIDWF